MGFSVLCGQIQMSEVSDQMSEGSKRSTLNVQRSTFNTESCWCSCPLMGALGVASSCS
jgi:hypothetical protein